MYLIFTIIEKLFVPLRYVLNPVRRVMGLPTYGEIDAADKLIYDEVFKTYPDDVREYYEKQEEYENSCHKGQCDLYDYDWDSDDEKEYCFGGTIANSHERHCDGLLVIECSTFEPFPEEKGFVPEYEVEAYWVKDGKVFCANDTACEKIPHLGRVGSDCDLLEIEKRVVSKLSRFIKSEERDRKRYAGRS